MESSPGSHSRETGADLLLAPDGATVFSEDGGSIQAHRLGPTPDVRFGRRAQRCQDIGGRFRGDLHTPRGDVLVVEDQKFPTAFPESKLGVPTCRNEHLSLHLVQKVKHLPTCRHERTARPRHRNRKRAAHPVLQGFSPPIRAAKAVEHENGTPLKSEVRRMRILLHSAVGREGSVASRISSCRARAEL